MSKWKQTREDLYNMQEERTKQTSFDNTSFFCYSNELNGNIEVKGKDLQEFQEEETFYKSSQAYIKDGIL